MGREYRDWPVSPTWRDLWEDWRALVVLVVLLTACLFASVYVAMGELSLPLRPAAIVLPFTLANLDMSLPRSEPRRLPPPRMAPSRAVPFAPWRMRRLWQRINRDMQPYGLGHMALATWRTHTPLAREIAIAVAIEHMRERRT